MVLFLVAMVTLVARVHLSNFKLVAMEIVEIRGPGKVMVTRYREYTSVSVQLKSKGYALSISKIK